VGAPSKRRPRLFEDNGLGYLRFAPSSPQQGLGEGMKKKKKRKEIKRKKKEKKNKEKKKH